MPFAPPDLESLATSDHDAIIDVRSPSEYAEDHVPGAVNLPVLDDDERARVGTIYVQQSAFLARKIGAAIVARNAARHIEGPLAGHDGGWRPLVYCWRGGQRSNSFAVILGQIGWRVSVLEGGYRSYRVLVKTALYDAPFPAKVVLLDGYTGTAKTDLLHLARARGLQILDLEGLANHRGSVFGGMGPQPSQKAFESALAQRIRSLDPARPVLVEAESSKIGDRSVPPSLWAAMRRAPRLTIEAPRAARADYLARTYTMFASDPGRLHAILEGLTRLQGTARVAAWRGLAAKGLHAELAGELMEWHYDPRYAKQRARGEPDRLATLETDSLDEDALERLADRIVATIGGVA
ncbi:tRNA 2-selenouridine(34) synthase MnmH [Palleronia aestuarii]|nr:tRNA 2-selenouridine(34) synthase MnmH [Palleronia aestuarii]